MGKSSRPVADQQQDDPVAILVGAANAQASGLGDIASSVAGDLIGSVFTDRGSEVDTAAERVVAQAVGFTIDNGWLPDDLFETVLRQMDRAAATYVADILAVRAAEHPAFTVHHRWLGQLERIGAEVWWDTGEPHLSQWAAKHKLSRFDALTMVIELMSILIVLPTLPRLLPLPGTVRDHTGGAHTGVDQKVLGRIRALLAKAESSTYPEEAESLSAKAQQLMTRYALDRALIDANAPGRGTVSGRRIWLDNPYLAIKALLVHEVSEANRCKAVMSEALGFVTVLGDEVDLELVELLSTSLLVQATATMIRSGKGKKSSGSRTYRQSFLIAYAHRIGERLSRTTEEDLAGATDRDRILPVLAARKREVDEQFTTMFAKTTSKRHSVRDADGWGAGRAAADQAVLDTRKAVRG